MHTQNNNSAVSVNFLIRTSSPTHADNCIDYDFVFHLEPSARAMPFEPFLSLLRHEYLTTPRHLKAILANTSLTVRLQQQLFAWIMEETPSFSEPTIPVEFHFEQSLIHKALFEIIQSAFLRKNYAIHIQNAQFLPVSSSELVQEIKNQGSSRLTIDLSLCSTQINDWWPQGDVQRQLKHRFLTSGYDSSEQTGGPNNISVHLNKTDLELTLFWANKLYCGDELNQLLSISALSLPTKQPTLIAECYALRAAVFLNDQEETHRIASRIESQSWELLTGDEHAFVFESLYLASVWFWHYNNALNVATRYQQWAQHNGSEEQIAYSLLLTTSVRFLLGNFRYQAEHCRSLEAMLKSLKWHNLLGFLISSYWFDHDYTLDASAQMISNTTFALDLAIADKNLNAQSRSLHYLSIVYLHIGALEKALHYIDLSIEKSRGLANHERTYNTLNGKAYLLIQMANYDAALTSVERAFAYVVNDGNYEQICTTMCNAALVALFSGHFNNAIKLLDDIFQIMLLRGLQRTRFRTNLELKSIQAVAAFLKGDHRIAIAIFKTRKNDGNHTLEGLFFSKLMTLVQHHYEQPSNVMPHRFEQLFETALHTHRHPLIALFVLRFQYELLKHAGSQARHSIAQKGLATCQQFNLPACQQWFTDNPTHANEFSERFLKLKAIKLTRREAQIDLLKVENNLLKLALDLEQHAQSCQDPLRLYDFCLLQLSKMPHLEFASIHIQEIQGEIYSVKVGQESSEITLPAHHFQFQYPQGNATLSIRFNPSTEVFNDALATWMGRLVDQLSTTTRNIIDRTTSYGLAYIDYLTGLGNRAAFERFFEQSRQLDCDVITVALVDLDNFKAINDQHGHLLGDEILRSFSKHLKKSIRDTDHLYRMGGDEFFLVFRNSTVTDIEPIITKQLQTFFQRQRKNEDAYYEEWQNLGCSTGLLQINLKEYQRLNREQIIQQADELMYRAKRRQKNGIETAVISL